MSYTFIKILYEKVVYMNSCYDLFLKQLDNNTEKHSHNVAEMCFRLAEHLNIDRETAYKVGLVHDIGKIYIPSRILKKSDKITPLEREIVDLHSYYGYRILRDRGESSEICIPVLFHHGFDKVKLQDVGEIKMTDEMNVLLKLVHSVDIYDAMISSRPYHTPFTMEEVYKVLMEDPLCDEKILGLIEKENAQEEKCVNQ